MKIRVSTMEEEDRISKHATANLRYYEQAAQEAQKQTHFHRQIAAELLQHEYAKSAAALGHHGDHASETELNSDVNNL